MVQKIIIAMFTVFLYLPLVLFALAPPGTNIGATIAPSDSADVYATHNALWGKGGYRTVLDTNVRNSISSLRRDTGMLVFCKSDSTTYQLMGGISNSNWVKTSLTDKYNYSGIKNGAFNLLFVNTVTGKIDTSTIKDFYIPGVANVLYVPKNVWFKDSVRFDGVLTFEFSPNITGFSNTHNANAQIFKTNASGGAYPFNQTGNWVFCGNGAASINRSILFYNGYNRTLMLKINDTSSVDISKKLKLTNTETVSSVDYVMGKKSSDSTIAQLTPANTRVVIGAATPQQAQDTALKYDAFKLDKSAWDDSLNANIGTDNNLQMASGNKLVDAPATVSGDDVVFTDNITADTINGSHVISTYGNIGGLTSAVVVASDVYVNTLTADKAVATNSINGLISVDRVDSARGSDVVDGYHGSGLLSRANHTGTQDTSTISNWSTRLARADTAYHGGINSNIALKLNVVDTSAFVRDIQLAGTANYLQISTGSGTIGNSTILKNGSSYGFGTTCLNSTGAANIGLHFDGVNSRMLYRLGTDDNLVAQFYGADENTEYFGVGIQNNKTVLTAGSGLSDNVAMVFKTALGGVESEAMRFTENKVLQTNGNYINNTGAVSKGLAFESDDDVVFTDTLKVGDDVLAGGKITAVKNIEAAGQLHASGKTTYDNVGYNIDIHDTSSTSSIDNETGIIFRSRMGSSYTDWPAALITGSKAVAGDADINGNVSLWYYVQSGGMQRAFSLDNTQGLISTSGPFTINASEVNLEAQELNINNVETSPCTLYVYRQSDGTSQLAGIETATKRVINGIAYIHIPQFEWNNYNCFPTTIRCNTGFFGSEYLMHSGIVIDVGANPARLYNFAYFGSGKDLSISKIYGASYLDMNHFYVGAITITTLAD